MRGESPRAFVLGATLIGSILSICTARAQDPPHGVWSIVSPPSPREGHTFVHDPAGNRIILFGGASSHAVWTFEVAGEPRWTQLILGSAPSLGLRSGHSAIIDPVGNRMILFGGIVNNANFPSNDVWSLSLSGMPTWTPLNPAGAAPAGRHSHAAFYDPGRHRMVVFGGDAPFTTLDDVWELTLGANPTWTLLAGPAPGAPRGRIEAAAFDRARDRILFVNTDGYSSMPLQELPLSAPVWSPVTIVGDPPPIRRGPSLVVDETQGVALLFGGESFGIHDETWSLSLADPIQWQLLPAQGTPPERVGHRAVFDPVEERMVVFGGRGSCCGLRVNDVWALPLSPPAAWVRLLPSDTLPPFPRSGHTVVRDELGHRDLLFGGFTSSSSCCDDTWAYTIGAIGSWTELPVVGPRPAMRYLHSAIHDPVRDRLIVYGGRAGPALGDVWALPLSGTPTWSQFPGPNPNRRYSHSAIYDPVRDRMIVFGGVSGSVSFGNVNEVWALSLSGIPRWSQIVPQGGSAPLPREEHTAIYDPDGDRMIVFGGQFGIMLADVWSLSLAGAPAWTELHPLGPQPEARMLHVAVHDPTRGRMIVQGGLGTNNAEFGDVWELHLGGTPQWTRLAPDGTAPGPGRDHAATFDPLLNRMRLFFGSSAHLVSEVWSLNFRGGGSATLASLVDLEVDAGRVRLVWIVANRSARATVYRRIGAEDWYPRGTVMPDGSGHIVFEDRDVTPGLSYAYRLGFGGPPNEQFSEETRVEVPLAGLALYPVSPNPSVGGTLVVRFSLATSEPADLQIIDVGGRRITRRPVGSLGLGTHTVTLADHRLPAGVYLLRLTQRGRAVTRRVVALE